MAKKTLARRARTKEPRAAAKKAAPARAAKAAKIVRPAHGELLTLLDFVRYAVSRCIEADVAFAHGTTDPVADAAFLICETLHLHPDQLEMFATARVTATESAKLLDLIEARAATRKPTAYLVNKIYMRGLPFYVDERVIVPRSFIGELLDSHFSGSDEMDGGALIDDLGAVGSVLDLCTGSGCLAILASRHFPNAQIDAVDLSKDALKVAAKNVADYGLADRITLHNGDLFAPLGDARYDLIISNPPYVDAQGMADLPRECRFEPKMAFDGGDDGLDIVHRILREAAWHLTPNGGLLCEIGRGRDVLEAAYPDLPMLWLDTEDSEGEVFWIDAATLATLA
jgi:ribosomal protein L3 glutamine methyltransferase